MADDTLPMEPNPPECEHGEDPRWCAWCKPPAAEAQGLQYAPLITGAVIDSQYDGTCSCCGTRYSEGDRIAYSADVDGWIIEAHGSRVRGTGQTRHDDVMTSFLEDQGG